MLHTYELQTVLGQGEATYHCPICAQVTLVQWVDGYPQQTVQIEGDPYAVHAFKITEAEDAEIRSKMAVFSGFINGLEL